MSLVDRLKERPELNENDQLHVDVVTGLVKVVKFIANLPSGKGSFTMGEICEAYETGNYIADDYVFEFIKDGEGLADPELVREVNEQDYGRLWASANRYLLQFGHPLSPYRSIEMDTSKKQTPST